MQGSQSTRGEQAEKKNWFRSQGPWANAWSMENHSPEMSPEDPGNRAARETGSTNPNSPVAPTPD